MKVLVIANSFPKPNNKNMGTYIYEQINAMENLGIEVVVVSPTIMIPKVASLFNEKAKGYYNIPIKYNFNNIKVYYPKMIIYNQFNKFYDIFPKLKYKTYEKSVYKFIEQLLEKEKFDCIYCHGIFLEGNLGIRLKERFDLPIVIIEHSMTNILNLEKKKYKVKTYREILEKCDKFICVSKKQKKIIKDKFNINNKIEVILNGINNDKITALNNSLIHDRKVINLISVGFLEEIKGHITLIEALNELKHRNIDGFSLKIIGEGKLRKKIQYLINEYKLNDRCELLGKLPHDEVINNMMKSDIFVLPSYNESFGIVYIEAMCCRLPVIATRGEGISDYIIDGSNGLLINKKDSNDLADKIEILIKDYNLRNKIKNNGYEWAKNLTWDSNAKRLKLVLEKVIGENI